MNKAEKDFLRAIIKICERLYIQKEVLLQMMSLTHVKDWDVIFEEMQTNPAFVEAAQVMFSFAYECIDSGALDDRATKHLQRSVARKKKLN